ncbi:MAG: ArnT family glycosyltransferase [Thermodesulfobacteriota bacterium]
MPRPVRKFDPVFLVLLAVVSFLMLYHLDHRPFWQDEAETACLARNVLKFGEPRAYDGVNLISQEAGREFNKDNIWRWSPWMQIYLAAGAFYLAHPSTTAGRLPFAILGILCVCLTYLLVRRNFGNLLWARLAAALLGLSVPFLLYARQCRYYSLATFLVLVGLYAFRLNWQKRWGPVLLLLASFGLLFHANYLIFFSYGAAFLLAALFFYRRELPLKRTLLLAGGIALVVLQGLVFFEIQKQGSMVDYYRIPLALQQYFTDLLQFIAPGPLALGLFCYWGWLFYHRKGRQKLEEDPEFRFTSFLAVIIILNILILSLAPQSENRYLLHLYPLCAVITGWIICKVAHYQKFSGVLLAVLLLFTNWLQILPLAGGPFRDRPVANNPYMLTYPNIPLKLFLSELLSPYPDTNQNLINFFQAHARPGDTILTTYGDLPLQFYTPYAVLGGLEGRVPAKEKPPQWVVQRWHTRWNRQYRLNDSEAFIRRKLRLPVDYEALVLPFEDEAFGNRPDPYFHRFLPEASPMNRLTIYRLRSNNDNKIIKHIR